MFQRLRTWWRMRKLAKDAKKWSLKYKHAAYEVIGERGIEGAQAGCGLREALIRQYKWRK